jgi:lipid II:glycine glycyltransferase (peptidoglycan interpeptide bridge formation enzyme)
VRKNVKKARRAGVEIEFDPEGARLDDFLRLYAHTLERRDAPERYRFPREFFERIHERLAGQFVYAHALHENQVVSSELVLLSARNAYSFLGGTESDAFDQRPNDLLKHEVILWAKDAGKARFVLGGGYGADDGIFRYKRSFAPHGLLPFFIGRRVLQPELYGELAEKAGATGDDTFFPAYRR